ncbi:MAG: hypothetical protein JST81_07585 [Bacteroidetes bacterium]|nr:hypothetical protein [Bacteroidota bacterium]
MKRKYTCLLTACFAVLFCSHAAFAQTSKNLVTPFKPGSITFNPGIGIGTDYKNNYAGRSAIGTKAALEFGIWKAGPGVVSLGPEAGISISSKANVNRRNDYRAHTFVLAARSAWHYGWRVPGLDTYAGVSAGIGFHHYDYTDDRKYDYNETIPVAGGFVGVSYFFTPVFGVNAEAGFDITAIQGGIIFKLR